MMRIPQIRTSVIFLLWCIAAECATGYAAVGASGNVRAGNRLYRDGKLDAALEKYHAASAALPDSDIVNFDIGAAWYKKEEYQKAAESFTKALTSEHKKIEADALYNLGNCKYKLGKLKENTDLATCVGLLRESLDYYKRAVAIDQKNADARFNHEVIERELKVLLDKMKKEPQQDQDKQEKKSQEQKEETKQGSGSADKQAGEKGKDNTGKKEEQAGQQQKKEEARQEQKNGPDAQAGKKEAGEKNKGAEAQQGETEKKEQGEEQKPAEKAQGMPEGSPQGEGEKKELSKEEARTLVERYGRDEAKPDYMDKRDGSGYDSQVAKDW